MILKFYWHQWKNQITEYTFTKTVNDYDIFFKHLWVWSVTSTLKKKSHTHSRSLSSPTSHRPPVSSCALLPCLSVSPALPIHLIPSLWMSTSSARHSPSSPPSTRGALFYSALLVESGRRRARGGAQAQHAHGRPSARLQRRRRRGLRLRWIRDPDHRLLEGSTLPQRLPLLP
jgi:hypothetical protein